MVYTVQHVMVPNNWDFYILWFLGENQYMGFGVQVKQENRKRENLDFAHHTGDF